MLVLLNRYYKLVPLTSKAGVMLILNGDSHEYYANYD